MAREPRPGASLATRPGALPHLGLRSDAPADPRRVGDPPLRAVPRPVPRRPDPGPGVGGGGAQGLGGGGVLRPGPPPPPRGPRAHEGPDRPVADDGRGVGAAPRGRPVHRPGRREPLLRAAGRRARGERPSGRRPVGPRDRRRPKPSRRRTPRPRAGSGPADGSARAVQRGDHGARRDRLPAEAPALRGLSDRAELRRPSGAPRTRGRSGASRPTRAPPRGGGDRARRAERPVPGSKAAGSGLLGGLWELPGGKVEPGETERAAVRRELMEEAGIRLDGLRPVGVVRHAYSHFTVELHLFWARSRGASAPVRERSELRWVTDGEFDALPRPMATVKALELWRRRPPGRASRGSGSRPGRRTT